MLDMMKISSGNDIFTDIPGNEQCQRIVKVFLYHLLLYPVRLLIMMTTLKKNQEDNDNDRGFGEPSKYVGWPAGLKAKLGK